MGKIKPIPKKKKRRRRLSWTPLNKHRLQVVQNIIDEYSEQWPLTVRNIHYQLVVRHAFWDGRRDNLTYQNTSNYNQDLSTLIKYGRIDGYISWDAIEDRTRSLYRPYKFEDIQAYLKNELQYILSDYQRCLVQDQEKYLELWVEKDGLFRIFKNSVHIPIHSGHPFRFIPDSDSNPKRTPIPIHFGHPFQSNPDSSFRLFGLSDLETAEASGSSIFETLDN